MNIDLSDIVWTEESYIKEIIQELDEIKCLDLVGKNTFHHEDTFSTRSYRLHNQSFSCGFVLSPNNNPKKPGQRRVVAYWYKETHGYREQIYLEDLLEEISEEASSELLFHLDLFRGL